MNPLPPLSTCLLLLLGQCALASSAGAQSARTQASVAPSAAESPAKASPKTEHAAGASASGRAGSSRPTSTETPSRAGQTAVASDAEQIDPRAEYHKGNAAFREGRLTAARFHYRRSVESDASFDAMCNLGRTEAALRDDVAAYEHLTRCLDLHPADPELLDSRSKFQELRLEVEQRMSDEQKQLAARRLSLLSTASDSAAEQGGDPARDSEPSASRVIVPLTLGAAALIGLGVGTGLFIHADAQAGQADALRGEMIADGVTCLDPNVDPRCGELSDLWKSSDDAHNASVVTLAVSGGVLLGAVVTYLVWPQSKARSAARPANQGPPDGSRHATWVPLFHVSVPEKTAVVGVAGRF